MKHANVASNVLVVSALVAAVAGFTACWQNNPNFCCTELEWCRRDGIDHTVDCEPGFVCVMEENRCIPDLDACTDNSDCKDSGLPFCVERKCKACDGTTGCGRMAPVCTEELTCTGCKEEPDCVAHSMTPHCDKTSGACVVCLDSKDCGGASPVCDAFACRGCRADSECGSEACDVATGMCLADESVIYLAPDGVPGECTRLAPCKTFKDQALTKVKDGRRTIRMKPGEYRELVDLEDIEVAIFGEGAVLTRPREGQVVGPLLEVLGKAKVRIVGLRIRGALDPSGGDGLRCSPKGIDRPTLTVQRARIEANQAQGIDATSCSVTVEQSTLSENTGGGISLGKADFTIRNSFIVKNGAVASEMGGVLVLGNPPGGTAKAILEFSTVVGNNAQGGTPSGVSCSNVGSAMPLKFNSNIVYDNRGIDGQVGGPNCSHAFSNIGPQVLTGNNNINMKPQFVSATDFHLQTGSPGIDAADPAATLAVDIDGDPRPNGSARDIGADEIKP